MCASRWPAVGSSDWVGLITQPPPEPVNQWGHLKAYDESRPNRRNARESAALRDHLRHSSRQALEASCSCNTSAVEVRSRMQPADQRPESSASPWLSLAAESS